MKFFVTCAFALEGVAAQELRKLGLVPEPAEGRVYFEGTERDAARACICLRSADRVELQLAAFPAADFDALYDGIRSLPWKRFISRRGRINVSASAVKSRLMSLRDIQSITKKAIISALGGGVLPENGEPYPINISILRDTARVSIDLCDEGLHKRGYRVLTAPAPLRETMAAALLLLSGYNGDTFADPFCGSGTLPIEAAMLARNIAPGARRSFAAEKMLFVQPALWKEEKQRAIGAENNNKPLIFCGDIAPDMVDITGRNAARAGVADIVKPCCQNALKLNVHQYGGLLLCNPPYGERLGSRNEAHELLLGMGSVLRQLCEQYWACGIITPDTQTEKAVALHADIRRRLFNADVACTFYLFKPQ